MLNFLMKCLYSRSIYSEVELIIKEMERCQSDQMAYVRGAAYEAMMTSKRIAGELESKMEKGCRSVTGSNFSRRNCPSIVNGHFPDDSLSPESQTLGSFSGYDSPVESSPISHTSCNSEFDRRSVIRKLWRPDQNEGEVDISLKDGLFSGVTKRSTTVSDSPLVPYDTCEDGDDFEGFLMESLRNRQLQNTTPSPQRQRSRRINAEDFNIFTTPRKLISSLQYLDDVELDHSDIQSPILGSRREKTVGSCKNPKFRKRFPTMAETMSSAVTFSEDTPQTQMITGKKKKKMSYVKFVIVVSFVAVALFTTVILMVNQDDVGYYTVPT